MGSVVKANCACGFEKEMFLGGGMLSFKTECCFPAYCSHCNKLFEVNAFDRHKICPLCKNSNMILYNDEKIYMRKGDVIVFDWDASEEIGKILVLTNGGYWCPTCCRFDLSFSDVGCWD